MPRPAPAAARSLPRGVLGRLGRQGGAWEERSEGGGSRRSGRWRQEAASRRAKACVRLLQVCPRRQVCVHGLLLRGRSGWLCCLPMRAGAAQGGAHPAGHGSVVGCTAPHACIAGSRSISAGWPVGGAQRGFCLGGRGSGVRAGVIPGRRSAGTRCRWSWRVGAGAKARERLRRGWHQWHLQGLRCREFGVCGLGAIQTRGCPGSRLRGTCRLCGGAAAATLWAARHAATTNKEDEAESLGGQLAARWWLLPAESATSCKRVCCWPSG